MNDDDRARFLQVAVEAARPAGAVARGWFTRAHELRVEVKGAQDFVSQADREVEDFLRRVLLQRLPQHAFFGEESGSTAGDARPTWIVDPIDGTTNFLHGFPHYAVSIGASQDGELLAGATLNVQTRELFAATADGGATLNGETIRASQETDPQRSLIGTGFPFKQIEHLPLFLLQFERVTRSTAGIRRAGSAALDLADTACGRFDAFWELGLAPWDVAAGLLLIREAGGIVTHLDGSPAAPAFGAYVAGGPAMHAWLLETLRAAENG